MYSNLMNDFIMKTVLGRISKKKKVTFHKIDNSTSQATELKRRKLTLTLLN